MTVAKESGEKEKPRDPLAQVIEWVLKGGSNRDITEAIRKNFKGKNAPALIEEAMKELRREGKKPPSVIRGFCIEATRELYRSALEASDFPTALRAIKQLAELAGKQTAKRKAESEPLSILE